MLHCLLRWLAGGSYIDIRLSAGISPAYFYTSAYKCMDAILGSEELSYKFPSTAKELEEAAQGFEFATMKVPKVMLLAQIVTLIKEVKMRQCACL